MNWDVLNLGLQAVTLAAGAYVTLFPPTRLLAKYAILAVIVGCGLGGIFAAHQASEDADARSEAAQAEIVRLSKEADERVAKVQERLENVSSRLAAKGIAARPDEEPPSATTALDTN